MSTPKPGILTSEAWLTAASYLIGLIALFHFTGRSSSIALAVVHAAAVIGPVIATAVYAFTRARVKGAHILAIGSLIKEVTAAIHAVAPGDAAAVIAAVEAVTQAFTGKPAPVAAAKPTAVQQAVAHAKQTGAK